MNNKLVEARAALDELRKNARDGTRKTDVLRDAVYDRLAEVGNVRAITSEEAHEKVELQMMAMNIWVMISESTYGLMRVIVLNGDASLPQKARAIAIWLFARRL